MSDVYRSRSLTAMLGLICIALCHSCAGARDDARPATVSTAKDSGPMNTGSGKAAAAISPESEHKVLSACRNPSNEDFQILLPIEEPGYSILQTLGKISPTSSLQKDNLGVFYPDELGTRDERTVTCGDLATIKSLKLPDVETLNMIEHLTGLEDLKVHNILSGDLSPLAETTTLKSLYIGPDNKYAISTKQPMAVHDLTLLAGLKQMEMLALLNGRISDLSPIAGLTAIRELDLAGNDISDLEPLRNLTGLEALRLSYNKIENIEPLCGLTGLKTLDLTGNEVKTLEPLAGLTSLKVLDLCHNEITDVSPLSGLQNLEGLFFVFSRITDIEPLVNLTSLKELMWCNHPDVWGATYTKNLPHIKTLEKRGVHVVACLDTCYGY